MPYNVFADSIHIKKLYRRLSSRKVHFLRKTAILLFERPLEGLGTTYDVHLGLTGKLVVDLLLLIIELISLGVTAEGYEQRS